MRSLTSTLPTPIECRRRVKEQMNKRKPDDEFAHIDLSYFDAPERRSSSTARKRRALGNPGAQPKAASGGQRPR